MATTPESARKIFQYTKSVSLLTLTIQNAALGLSMRYARTRPGDMFLSSTAVLMAEAVKLLTSLSVVFYEEGSFRKGSKALYKNIMKEPLDTLKVCIPSLVYVVQNNLLYLSASHLDAATCQVTYQLKILTTAMFSIFILRKSLFLIQWTSLVVLMFGVVLVQLAQTKDNHTIEGIEQNKALGFVAALSACFLSGFAGIYFEKILKGADVSLWMRNVQLSFLSIPLALITCLLNDWLIVMEHGLFFGYDYFVIYLVFLQALGGLAVAMVVKYADNILKGFATSLAIVISCILSVYFFDFQISGQFLIGVSLVIISIIMYNYTKKDSYLHRPLTGQSVAGSIV